MVGGSRGHTSPRAFSMLARMALGAVLWYFRVSLVAQMVSACNVRDPGLIPKGVKPPEAFGEMS